jgi:hypothetical protein
MAKIKITRTSEWSNYSRKIGIYLDGQKIGIISNGETKDFDVPPGQHSLKAKIDWCGSKDFIFTANENDTTMIKIGGFKYANYLLPILGGLSIACIVFKILLFALIMIPVLIIISYYLTIGRDRYLIIKEI